MKTKLLPSLCPSFILYLVVLAMLSSACKKNNEELTPPPKADENKINGREFKPTQKIYIESGKGLSISLADAQDTLLLHLPSKTSGTYAICQTGNCRMQAEGATGTIVIDGEVYEAISGSVTTTMNANGTLSASFNFSANSGSKTINAVHESMLEIALAACKLVKVSFTYPQYPDENSTYQFEYDGQGKITKCMKNDRLGVMFSYPEYNGEKITRYLNEPLSNAISNYYNFVYDGNGNVTKQFISTATIAEANVTTYSYDDFGRRTFLDSPVPDFTYEYKGGDVWKKIYKGSAEFVVTNTYEYDLSRLNLLRPQEDFLELFMGIDASPTQHMQVKDVVLTMQAGIASTRVTNISYTYNEWGYPLTKTAVTTYASPNPTTDTFTTSYVYDCK